MGERKRGGGGVGLGVWWGVGVVCGGGGFIGGGSGGGGIGRGGLVGWGVRGWGRGVDCDG